MKWDLSNWKPSCEQAKHMAGSFRIAGIALFASVAGPVFHAILLGRDSGFIPHLFVLISLCDWVGLEAIGYAILGKGEC
jgi:hypothetical protein